MKNTLQRIFFIIFTFGLACASNFSSAQNTFLTPSIAVGSPIFTSEMTSAASSGLLAPVAVMATAHDLVTKVYGIVPASSDRAATIDDAERRLHVSPTEEESGVWMNSESGYKVNYYGMEPKVSAMAVFKGEQLTDYGYLFTFPYNSVSRDEILNAQAQFCGSLLQELSDIGAELQNNLIVDNDAMSDVLFNVAGVYDGSQLRMKLIDEKGSGSSDSEGTFILLMTVRP